ARRGVSCWAVAADPSTPLKASRSIQRVVLAPEWSRDAVLDTLQRLGREIGAPSVLLLSKDESVLWVSSAERELTPWFRIALPPPAVVDLLMNKAQFYARALERGWPVPRGFLCESETEIESVLNQVPFPVILKPQLRNSTYRKQRIAKGFRIENPTELREAYRTVARWEPEVIISEWIEGRDDQLYSCRGVWDRDGGPVVHHAARKLMQWPVQVGNMAALEIPAPEDWKEPLRIANEVFREVRMCGIGAMEFKRAPDGRFLILEPCVGRTVYSHEIGPLNGYDIPWAAYRFLATEPSDGASSSSDGQEPPPSRLSSPERVPQPPPARGSLRLIDGPRARKAAVEYVRRGIFTQEEVRQVLSSPHLDMTYRREDPWPSVRLSLRRWVRRIRNMVNRRRTSKSQ
ncbi:MAG: hypothetical protein R3E12_19805, partial [Candidatus Eisenbacteria bacterium]